MRPIKATGSHPEHMTEPPIVPGVTPEQAQPYAVYYGAPPVPQIITKPGGLSTAAHAVHILISFFTCGLWLIPYALIVIFSPSTKYEVVTPVGADPAAVRAAYAQVAQATARERREASRIGNVPVWFVVLAVLAVFAGLFFLALALS